MIEIAVPDAVEKRLPFVFVKRRITAGLWYRGRELGFRQADANDPSSPRLILLNEQALADRERVLGPDIPTR
jgi:hypothetical protein